MSKRARLTRRKKTRNFSYFNASAIYAPPYGAPHGNNPARTEHNNSTPANANQIQGGIPTTNSYANTVVKANSMADECRRTIVGRFISVRPQIDRIRSLFSELFSLKGSVKIGVYDNFNVFLDFTNDEDFTIWFKRSVKIDGLQMWLQKWSPDFKLEEDLPIVPVLVLLPQLPFHLHTWYYLRQITREIGTPLEMDTATRSKTRPSMAKVRVEVDLLKPLLTSVWVGDKDEDSPIKGFVQKVEYEYAPKFCKHCKKLGHSLVNCRVLERIRIKESTETETKSTETSTKADDNEKNVANKKIEESKGQERGETSNIKTRKDKQK